MDQKWLQVLEKPENRRRSKGRMLSKALPNLLLRILHLFGAHVSSPALKLFAIETDVVEVGLSVLRLVNLPSQHSGFLLGSHLLVLLQKFWCELVLHRFRGYITLVSLEAGCLKLVRLDSGLDTVVELLPHQLVLVSGLRHVVGGNF